MGLWQTLAFVLRAKTKMKSSTMYLEVWSNGELAESIELVLEPFRNDIIAAFTVGRHHSECCVSDSFWKPSTRQRVEKPLSPLCIAQLFRYRTRSVYSMQKPLAYSVSASIMNLVDEADLECGGDSSVCAASMLSTTLAAMDGVPVLFDIVAASLTTQANPQPATHPAAQDGVAGRFGVAALHTSNTSPSTMRPSTKTNTRWIDIDCCYFIESVLQLHSESI